jgi:hypothetical protein
LEVGGGTITEVFAADGEPTGTEPVGDLGAGTNEAGKGTGTTGTELVGGFAEIAAPVEGEVGTGPVGDFDTVENEGITAVLLAGAGTAGGGIGT